MAIYNPDKLVGFIQKLFPRIDGDKIIAWVRTVVPVFVGSALAGIAGAIPAVTDWLTNVYPQWQIALGALAVTLVTGVYYGLARKIESKYPKAGKWLLGSAAKPVYVDPAQDIILDD